MLYLHNCKRSSEPCPPYPDTFYYQIDTFMDKYFIPYSGHDTLKFLRNNVDTHVFIGQGREYYYNIIPEIYSHDCDPDILKLQGYTIKYKGQTISKDLNFSHYMLANSIGITYISINFLGKTFKDSPESLRPPYPYDSIYIQNKMYRHVNFIPKDDIVDTIYYCPRDGIIKISFVSRDKWEIIKW